jgi:hypothetical protein
MRMPLGRCAIASVLVGVAGALAPPPPANAQTPSITSREVEALQRLLAVTPDGAPDKLGIRLRLAELYQLQARTADEQAARSNGATADAQRLAADKWRLLAIKEYLLIVDRPDPSTVFAQDDVALTRLAQALVRVGREEMARKFFKRLIVDHPGSPLVAEAYVSFGDYFFDRREWASAAQFYDRVAALPWTRAQPYARYKRAWCDFERDNLPAALAGFIALGRETADAKVAAEARRDAVRVYARLPDGEAARAARVLRDAFGDDAAEPLLDELAKEYRAAGKADACRTLARGEACD